MINLRQLSQLSHLRQGKVERFQRDLARARAYVTEAEAQLAACHDTYARVCADQIRDNILVDGAYMADPASRFIAVARSIERKRQREADARAAISVAQDELAEVTRNVDWMVRILYDAEARKTSVNKLLKRAEAVDRTRREEREEERATEQFMAHAGVSQAQPRGSGRRSRERR
ncbi:MAG: hypothetical protein AAF943_17940 [Pseudomonadota bacterium]